MSKHKHYNSHISYVQIQINIRMKISKAKHQALNHWRWAVVCYLNKYTINHSINLICQSLHKVCFYRSIPGAHLARFVRTCVCVCKQASKHVAFFAIYSWEKPSQETSGAIDQARQPNRLQRRNGFRSPFLRIIIRLAVQCGPLISTRERILLQESIARDQSLAPNSRHHKKRDERKCKGKNEKGK